MRQLRQLLDPLDLKEPYSAISGSRDLEVRETRHLYLLQTKLADRIRAWVDERAPNWPMLDPLHRRYTSTWTRG